MPSFFIGARAFSDLNICIAVVKEKPREKSWIYFRKSAGLSLSSVVCCPANRSIPRP